MGEASRWKPCTHAWRKGHFTLVRHQRWGPLKNVNELVLSAVAMKQRRLSTRRQGCKIDTEVLDAEKIAQRTLLAPKHPAEEWYWISLTVLNGLEPALLRSRFL